MRQSALGNLADTPLLLLTAMVPESTDTEDCFSDIANNA